MYCPLIMELGIRVIHGGSHDKTTTVTQTLFSILFSFTHSTEVTLQENVATAQGGKRSPCRRRSRP